MVDPNQKTPSAHEQSPRRLIGLRELWDRIPGTRDDGTINGEALEKWIKEARTLAKVRSRRNRRQPHRTHALSLTDGLRRQLVAQQYAR